MESAGLWHRRMGHINGKRLDVLRKEPTNGVDYTGDVKDCSVCPLGKSTQNPHPKQADYGVLRPFQLVSVDTLGPFSPPTVGGFKYAAKFVDQQTKWKEVVLMKDKTCSTKGPSFPPVSASAASSVTRARSLRVLTSASTAKTLASSWSLPLRTPLSRSARTSVRAGRF